jgi:hypothetical protein
MIYQLENHSDVIEELSKNTLDNFLFLDTLVNFQCKVYTTNPTTISNFMILTSSFDEIFVSIDGSSVNEINELLDFLPKEQSLRFFLHKPYLENIVIDRFEFTPERKTFYLITDENYFTPNLTYESRLISEYDNPVIIQFANELAGVIRSRFLKHIELQLNGETWKTFIVLDQGQIVSYTGFCHYFDNIWVEDYIYTPEKWRRNGYAKSALSLATKVLLQDGLVPFATIDSDNTASINVHSSIGYYVYLGVVSGIGIRKTSVL